MKVWAHSFIAFSLVGNRINIVQGIAFATQMTSMQPLWLNSSVSPALPTPNIAEIYVSTAEKEMPRPLIHLHAISVPNVCQTDSHSMLILDLLVQICIIVFLQGRFSFDLPPCSFHI